MPEPHTALMVDDDREIVTAATLRLRAAGYRTLTAYDGDSAVAVAAKRRPDVILLDVLMPRKDGLTALRELKQRDDTKSTPVVMLSACIGNQQASLDAGARFFLRKPYSGDTLVRAVTKALESSSDSS
jgi:CheY-like chemotaxis protein